MMPAPENVEEARREAGLSPPQPARERLTHAWHLTARYFVSSDWKLAWLLLLLYVGFNGIQIVIMVWSNQWQQHFYDTLQNRVANALPMLILLFIGIQISQVGSDALKDVISWTLTIRWRRWLTETYVGRWMSKDRFYEIERLRLIDNPDQRISEDVATISALVGGKGGSSPLVLIVGLVTNLITAMTFAAILMKTARPINLSWLSPGLALQGDTIWIGITYVVISSALITLLGKPYVRRRMRLQHYEADFRSGLVHVRRNGEQIAFAGTHKLERQNLAEAFANISRNWNQLLWRSLAIDAGTGVYKTVRQIAPLFITVPRFFRGEISFGEVMAAQGAFLNFTMALSYFIEVYPSIAAEVANINRVKALDDAIDYARPRGIGVANSSDASGVAILAKDLTLHRPHGAPLMSVGDWTVRSGERWVIEGPSGAGKTTLLRAVAGLWPDGDGTVTMTENGRAMFVPQRLYLPLGTLKDAICFPDRADDHPDSEIAELLERVSLPVHISKMHEIRRWQEDLSPGEQQRVALARILLQRPELLVLDEATSALDIGNARHFHDELLKTVPNVTVVSVVHNERLSGYYTHRLRVADGMVSSERIEIPG
jgi:vitamin B12/bleomycin/antimicrobial peptide transport system ATP-binding/permease protein